MVSDRVSHNSSGWMTHFLRLLSRNFEHRAGDSTIQLGFNLHFEGEQSGVVKDHSPLFPLRLDGYLEYHDAANALCIQRHSHLPLALRHSGQRH
ncbi:hypothetical protein TNCV_3927111 [Trichonephila clavipes]|nr:hypothetical protein TNCV_3927111 [Trichonephila clavipes]